MTAVQPGSCPKIPWELPVLIKCALKVGKGRIAA